MKPMQVVFRTDASIEIGSGHVMRCLTLANALAQQGAECHFICREHPGHLLDSIQAQGHRVIALPVLKASAGASLTSDQPAHATWLGATQEEDAQLCQDFLKDLQPDWLIVDHYALDYVWESRLQPYCKHLMVVDDLADRHHQCDLLLDQTYGRKPSEYSALVPEHCEILCGADYALLRPEFAQWREYSLKRRADAELKQLLINLGGVDKDNVTTQVLAALQSSDLPDDCRIIVVMGSSAPWIESVAAQAQKLPWTTDVKVGVSHMAELMAESDLAIGAAGATSWERCCLGLPSILVVLAANQQQVAEQISNKGAAICVQKQEVSNRIVLLMSRMTRDQLYRMSEAANSLVDGRGLQRILRRIGART